MRAPNAKRRAERLVTIRHYGPAGADVLVDESNLFPIETTTKAEQIARELRRILTREFRKVADARTRRIIKMLRKGRESDSWDWADGFEYAIALAESIIKPKRRKSGAK